MVAKNGINWEDMGFTVYGECPTYKGYKTIRKNKDTNISYTQSYRLWERLIQIDRGNEGTKGRLCDDWKEYENFKKWYDENYYDANGIKTEFSYRFWDCNNDYISPDTSVFLPTEINKIIRNLSIGKQKDNILMINTAQERKDSYIIRLFGSVIVRSDNKLEIIEIRKTILKRQMIDLAEQYEDVLPEKVYEKLLDFEAEVWDGEVG